MTALAPWRRRFSIRLRMQGATAMVLTLLALVCLAAPLGGQKLVQIADDFVLSSVQGLENLSKARENLAQWESGADPPAQQQIAELNAQLQHVTWMLVALSCLTAEVVIPPTLLNSMSVTRPMMHARDMAPVNGAVIDLDHMTQHNAAAVEQRAAAADSLNQRAVRLNDVVARFHIAA